MSGRGMKDYIDDIPLEIGSKFYPPPTIRLPKVVLPDLSRLPDFKYSLEVEYRARDQFENANKIEDKPSPPTIPARTNSTHFGSSFSQDVLIPVQAASSQPKTTQPVLTSQSNVPHSLVEFETSPTIFDDLAINALDEKAVLFDVLSSTSYNSNSNTASSASPVSAEEKPIPPPYPTHQPVASSTPFNPNPPAPLNRENSPSVRRRQKEDEMKKKLVEKGFRQDIIDKTIATLPYARLVHVEYYMKGARMLEKTGHVTIDEGLSFLNQSALTDKQKILQYSEDACRLVGMGFDRQIVFKTLIDENGDHMKAMEKILAAS